MDPLTTGKSYERPVLNRNNILQGFANLRNLLENRTLQLFEPASSTAVTIDELRWSPKKKKSKPTTPKPAETTPRDDIKDRDIDSLNKAYNNTLTNNEENKPNKNITESNNQSSEENSKSEYSSDKDSTYDDTSGQEDEDSDMSTSSENYLSKEDKNSSNKQTDVNDSAYHMNFETKFGKNS